MEDLPIVAGVTWIVLDEHADRSFECRRQARPSTIDTPGHTSTGA